MESYPQFRLGVYAQSWFSVLRLETAEVDETMQVRVLMNDEATTTGGAKRGQDHHLVIGSSVSSGNWGHGTSVKLSSLLSWSSWLCLSLLLWLMIIPRPCYQV